MKNKKKIYLFIFVLVLFAIDRISKILILKNSLSEIYINSFLNFSLIESEAFKSSIFVLISLCERAELKKNKNDYIKGKIKVKIALSVFIFYCLLYPLFIVFLKYSSTNSDWYEEIGMVCVNIVMLALIPLYLYVKKQIVHFFTDMPIKA